MAQPSPTDPLFVTHDLSLAPEAALMLVRRRFTDERPLHTGAANVIPLAEPGQHPDLRTIFTVLIPIRGRGVGRLVFAPVQEIHSTVVAPDEVAFPGGVGQTDV